MKTKTNDSLTQGPVFPVLLRFSLPYLAACFLQQLYGLADLFIVGQFEGTEAVTAVSIGSQFMHMVTAVIIGLAMGSTVLISRASGAQNARQKSLAIGNTITLFGWSSLFLLLVLLLARSGILSVLSVPSEAWAQCRTYMTICFLGIPVITAYNILTCIYRGAGDSKSPMYFVAAACLINIALDYVFVGALGLSAMGAAAATVIAQLASALLAAYWIPRKLKDTSLERKDFILQKQVARDLLQIGVPIAFQDGIIQVSFLIITAIGNQRGLIDAAAIGIVEKMISFFFLVPSALSQSLSALASMNVGAGKYLRAFKTLKYAVAAGLVYGLGVVAASWLFGENLVSLFVKDAQVAAAGAGYLKSYSLDALGVAVHFCMSSYFCAFKKSMVSFIQNFLSVILFRIPGAWLGSRYFPETLFYMGLAAPAGSLFQSVFCILYFKGHESFFLGRARRLKKEQA